MKPFLKEYTNDEKLQEDIQLLSTKGVHKDNIYVLSHDDDRTKRVSSKVDANTIGLSEMDAKSAVGSMFSKQGDELRAKLKDIGFSQEEAEDFEEDLDEGKIFLIVKDTDNVEGLLI
ncbi:Heat induced stress protein YflT [Terribacillus aidingensis]|uniref:Heat induced stress protein YflT n=1 Tax=Terribacillus aidingensis TaxID=586416 RepID=A0A285NI12_9BACI|nr:general stress protein [Terribacillus aidingensis]SNZ09134.1 Heat induced stress protein YflT [Terribacillus aidingensis]